MVLSKLKITPRDKLTYNGYVSSRKENRFIKLTEPTQSENAKTIIVHGPRPILCHIKISRYLKSNMLHSQLVSLHSIGHTLLNLGLKLTQSLCTQRLYRPDLYNVVMCMHRHYYFGYTIDTLLLQESTHVQQHYLHQVNHQDLRHHFTIHPLCHRLTV